MLARKQQAKRESPCSVWMTRYAGVAKMPPTLMTCMVHPGSAPQINMETRWATLRQNQWLSTRKTTAVSFSPRS